jgi:predicted nucleic acid-binding protein
MSDDLTLLDANVLVYASFPASEYYSASRKILESASAGYRNVGGGAVERSGERTR